MRAIMLFAILALLILPLTGAVEYADLGELHDYLNKDKTLFTSMSMTDGKITITGWDKSATSADIKQVEDYIKTATINYSLADTEKGTTPTNYSSEIANLTARINELEAKDTQAESRFNILEALVNKIKDIICLFNKEMCIA